MKAMVGEMSTIDARVAMSRMLPLYRALAQMAMSDAVETYAPANPTAVASAVKGSIVPAELSRGEAALVLA